MHVSLISAKMVLEDTETVTILRTKVLFQSISNIDFALDRLIVKDRLTTCH